MCWGRWGRCEARRRQHVPYNLPLTLRRYVGGMSLYRRPRIPGASIAFTVALSNRGDDLLLREITRLRMAVAATLHNRPFRIDAWVVLPDHLHAVWTLPEGDSSYALRWAAIKAAFSSGLSATNRRDSHRRRREKGIWQRRFWEHHLRGEDDWQAAVNDCWHNPVKHGLVCHPADWPYSSWHRDMAPQGDWHGCCAGPVGCASAHHSGEQTLEPRPAIGGDRVR